MPLFRVSTRGLVPFRLVTDSVEAAPDVTAALVEALWSDLDAVTGLRLMPVRRGTASDDETPLIVALDDSGNIVVLYAGSHVDSVGLAVCLEHVGWARGVTVSELASGYWRGGDEFWRDWQEFSGTSSPVPADAGSRTPMLFVVATGITDSAEAALEFLTDAGVPVRVLRAAVYADDHGCQLLELGDRPSAPQQSAEPVADGSRVDPRNRPGARLTASQSREVPESGRGQSPGRFTDVSDRHVPAGRGIDVGAMNRGAADELFAGGDPQRQQSRFARPVVRGTGDDQTPAASVSPLRRKPLPDDDVQGLTTPPQLAPLRFPAELVEPEFGDELFGPLGGVLGNGNGNGNGRGSHSA